MGENRRTIANVWAHFRDLTTNEVPKNKQAGKKSCSALPCARPELIRPGIATSAGRWRRKDSVEPECDHGLPRNPQFADRAKATSSLARQLFVKSGRKAGRVTIALGVMVLARTLSGSGAARPGR